MVLAGGSVEKVTGEGDKLTTCTESRDGIGVFACAIFMPYSISFLVNGRTEAMCFLAE